jgi:hypothetical protein
MRAVDLAHPARSNQGANLVRADACAEQSHRADDTRNPEAGAP